MSKRKKSDDGWRNRIVGTGAEDPAQLLANPFNHRIHGKYQKESMGKMLDGIGWLQTVIVNRTTGHILDGHMRVELSLKKGVKQIPVSYVELSEDEEKVALVAYDAIGAMAATDHKKMADLVRDVQAMDARANELAKAATAKTKTQLTKVLEDEEMNAARQVTPDEDVRIFKSRPIFSSTNKWEIPDLLPDRLSDIVPRRVWAGTNDLHERPDDVDECLFLADRLPGQWMPKGGTLCFYVWDEHFEPAWWMAADFLERHKKLGWKSVITPDFSVWINTPLALATYEIYRQRWVARYWQEAGFMVVPNLHTTIPAMFDFNIETMPKAPVLAMQCRTDAESETSKSILLRTIQAGIEHCKPDAIIIYGGEEHKHWIAPNVPSGPEIIFLSSVANIRLKYNKSKKAQKQEEHTT